MFSISFSHSGCTKTQVYHKTRVLTMLAGDPTGSGWDHWSEYVATSKRIQ